MQLMPRFLLLATFIAASSAFGQNVDQRFIHLFSRSYLRNATSIEFLPKHIPAPDGQISIYADFNDVEGEKITIYLVNRTRDRIAFAAQDGDPYLKLEHKNKAGLWERAQGHANSWCGNSYMHKPTLRPNEYFKTTGYFPSDGHQALVRYRIYSLAVVVLGETENPDGLWLKRDQEKIPIYLVSNAGPGYIRLPDVEYARKDSLASRFGLFETVRDLATGKIGGVTPGASREFAIRELYRFPTHESLDAINEILDENEPRYMLASITSLAKMGLEFAPAEEQFHSMFSDGDRQVRMYALLALKERPVTCEVIEFAKQQLSDEDVYVRACALGVIASQCKADPEAKAFVNEMYESTDPKIQAIFQTMYFPTCIANQKSHTKP